MATLLRLATPNVLVIFVQASVGLIETYLWQLGTDALAGVALVFPVLMLMQMMSAGHGRRHLVRDRRALGAGRRADAEALVLHALAIAVSFGLVFMLAVLPAAPGLRRLGWEWSVPRGGADLLQCGLLGAVLIWVFNSLSNVIRGTAHGRPGHRHLCRCRGVIPCRPSHLRLGAVAVARRRRCAVAVVCTMPWGASPSRPISGRGGVLSASPGLASAFAGAAPRYSAGGRGRRARHRADQSHIAIATVSSAGSGRRPSRATALARVSSTCWFPSSSG